MAHIVVVSAAGGDGGICQAWCFVELDAMGNIQAFGAGIHPSEDTPRAAL